MQVQREIEKEKGRKRERASTHWFTTRMAAMARSKPRARSFISVSEAKILGQSSVAFPRAAGSEIEQPGYKLGSLCNPGSTNKSCTLLCYNAGFALLF